MEKQNSKTPRSLKVYKGKLFDVIVTNQTTVSPERIRQLTNSDYQQQEYQRVLANIKAQYGNALEQLKYL